MKKEYIIGAVALTAVVGGYLWYKSRNKVIATSDEPTPSQTAKELPNVTKYEGKNVVGVDDKGNYAGGSVYLVKNGVKVPYGNDKYDAGFGLNWDEYVRKNKDDAIGLSQSELEKIGVLEAYLELADGNGIKGWTGSRKNDVPTPNIDIYINDKKVQTVKPSSDRPELDPYLNSNTGMNFEYIPNNLKSGETYKINAKYAGTKTDIRNSPLTFKMSTKTGFSGDIWKDRQPCC